MNSWKFLKRILKVLKMHLRLMLTITTKTFEKAQDIILIQYVANVDNELVFATKEENGKYFISSTFDLFIDNIVNGNVSRDVFQSVSSYFWDVIENEDKDFEDEKDELITFLLLTEEYDENDLIAVWILQKYVPTIKVTMIKYILMSP